MDSYREPRYWIAVASRDHVMTGVTHGFMQANHGKSSPLRRVFPGDWIIYYSSKLIYGQKTACQNFTAIGQVKEGEVYTADMGNGFVPARRDVNFYACEEIAIRPLIPALNFIKDKQRWGYMFCFGLFEIYKDDYELISQNMLLHQILSYNTFA